MAAPTIVFVPGAWHGPEAFDAVRKDLDTRGYPTSAVSLPSVGTNDSSVAIAADTAAVRAELESLVNEGKDVVLVVHSYGGIPGSNAVRGLSKAERSDAKGSVLMVVYMAAFAIPAGTCLLDGLGGQHLPWWDIQNGFVRPKTPVDIFYADVDPELAAKTAATLLPEPWAIFTDKCEYEPWKHGIVVGYIFAEDDSALLLEAQKGMASQFPEGSYTASLAASHSPFLSMPKKLGEAIEGAAKHAVVNV
ncbi:Alpha/beta hydrolase fold-1 [Plectosphaerella plurivora]|uniref:Alpha/beta hydrolase fold-1 n=1 Tax=Plectosphaerella plurivora TaxID=936078 RepID=A0A9P9A6Z5_9PEZI|nr:Alpha/beta hydrolase fold-1 [Plectosphaerella plurivora]